ncbi:MAG: glutamate-1-semialdehyde 2,1-aminomutase [Luteitalea sp.]|nr:glutamate-1-semialdehyde 2,1-aminomutase [Luteitalea sp.]
MFRRAPKSARWFARAQEVLPGGVDSPVRAFNAVGETPRFIARAKGATMTDVDGRTYIDYVMSWGPLLHGHAPRKLIKAVAAAAKHGTSFGASTALEVLLAERVRALMPSMEMVRFVSSGTEATMSALRVARAATKREKVIKFAGCYHGHADPFLVEAGSGATTLGVPTSPGVPDGAAATTLSAPYNDLETVERVFAAHPDEVAAVIIEPIAGNMGVVPPRPAFLEGLRTLCTRENTLLIFDEVISGFRVTSGGAQELYGVRPDLTCLGKIIGGGLPVGAYGGRADLMCLVAPAGPVYQAGTLSGNPLAMTAGLWALGELSPQLYTRLERLGARLADGLLDAAARARVSMYVNRVGSILTPFFTDTAVIDYASACRADTGTYARFFQGMLAKGIYPPPSQFEAWFLSTAHDESLVDRTIKVAQGVLKRVGAKG